MVLFKPAIADIIAQIDKHYDYREVDFILLCGEKVAIDYPTLIASLNDLSIHFCGGIFPQVIYNESSYDDAVLILPVKFEQNPVLITGLDNGEITIPEDLQLEDAGSLFILNDGLSNWISKFIFRLYDEIGSDYQVLGSGTGFSTFEREPCLFCAKGFYKDAAIIVPIANNIQQSAKHGWTPVAGPYLATKTSANLLMEVN